MPLMQRDPRGVPASPMRIIVEEEFRFDTGSFAVDQKYVGLLNLGVAALKALPETHLVVTGYTDNVGSAEVNQSLSEQGHRSWSANWMAGGGIPTSRIIALGRGPADPIATNSTSEGRHTNRRIEATLEGITPRPEPPGRCEPAARSVSRSGPATEVRQMGREPTCTPARPARTGGRCPSRQPPVAHRMRIGDGQPAGAAWMVSERSIHGLYGCSTSRSATTRTTIASKAAEARAELPAPASLTRRHGEDRDPRARTDEHRREPQNRLDHRLPTGRGRLGSRQREDEDSLPAPSREIGLVRADGRRS